MKEPKGIKKLSIAALAGHLGLCAFFGSLTVSRFVSTEFNLIGSLIAFSILFTLLASPALYPIQLLLIRRNYYRNIPASPAIMTWTHICRILQLLETIFMVLTIIITINSIYLSYGNEYFNARFDYIRRASVLLMCASI